MSSGVFEPPGRPAGLVAVVATATVCRLLLNTARRFIYPFAPALSRGLGIPLGAVTSLIAVNQITAVLGLFFGPLSDRIGYRRMMLAALLLLAVGMLGAAAIPVYGVLLAGLFLAGLGKTIFDAAMQAYVGQRVPFRRRGLVIGILELSWAGSTLITIPLIGLLIAYFGWRSPFLLLGLLALAGMLAAGRVLAAGVRSNRSPHSLLAALRLLTRERSARGAMAFGFCVSVANENLFVIYGAWLENDFALSIVALGFSTMAIGTAEMVGELLTAGFADRFGLKRTVLTSLAISGFSYALLPLATGSLLLALAGLFMVFLSLELTIVSFLSLCTELLPTARATMMAGFFAAAGMGRVLGALIGAPVWSWNGIVGNCTLSVLFTVLALGALLWGLHRWQPIESQAIK